MQRRIVLFVFALFAAACSHDSAVTAPSTSTTTPTPAGPSTLSGKVVDQISQQAIAGAALTLVDPAAVNPTLATKADGAGNFSFANVAAGTYLLQTDAAGYLSTNAGVTVPAGSLTIQLLRPGVQPSLPLLVAISGTPSTMKVGQTVQLTAMVVYTDGTRSDVTNLAKWTSDTPAVASVSASGVLTAFSAGTATISATIENVGGSTPPVTVTPR